MKPYHMIIYAFNVHILFSYVNNFSTTVKQSGGDTIMKTFYPFRRKAMKKFNKNVVEERESLVLTARTILQHSTALV